MSTPARTIKRRITRTRANPDWKARRWGWVALALVSLMLTVWLVAVQPWKSEPSYLVAVVGPMSGPQAGAGKEMLNGAQLAIETLGATRSGPRLELAIFDNEGDPVKAQEIAERIVADDRILVVIDFSSSATTLAAAPIYDAADLAVIPARATADALERYPSYFRLTADNSTEGALLARYVTLGLDHDRASMIVGPGAYEGTVSEAFSQQFSANGAIVQTWPLTGNQRDAAIAAIVDGLRTTPDPGIVFLALTGADAHDVLLAIRRAGLNPVMVGAQPLSAEDFGRAFEGEPEDQVTPGFFTEGLYATIPMLYESIGGDALAVARRYQETYGAEPGWLSAKGYDALLTVDAATRTGLTPGDATHRERVIANLHAIDSPDTALPGISGPLFFNDRGFVPQGLSLGQFIGGYFVSAPVQYRLVTDPDLYDLDEEIARGQAFELKGRTFREYRVVYVGVEMIELRDLQIGQQSYTADFFIYFRYFGDDSPVNVVFSNANTDLTLGDPLQSSTDPDGLTYQLYRVRGDFSESMDFTDYPWDEHLLTIRLQNLTAEQTDLIYVPDPAVLTTSQAQRQGSGFDLSRPFNQIPNWHISSVDYAHVSITSTTDEYDAHHLVHYSEFRVLLDLERDVRSFLIKNLLPLTLLTVVTYISLWLPPEEARTRVGFSITALLTSAVMLNTISSRLPDIGYTVAIEWGFYTYIGVVAVLGLLNVVVYRNYRAKRFARVRALDTFIRIFYPMVVLGTVAVYIARYG